MLDQQDSTTGQISTLMNKTRFSLFYLGSYLSLIGFGLLLAPHGTLGILHSNGNYGDIMPRVSGMLMSGLGLSIFGMIRARSYNQYPSTLVVRAYFIACMLVLYAMSRDPMFLVLLVIVGFGFILTLSCYLIDRKRA
jgi:hypothetical protein